MSVSFEQYMRDKVQPMRDELTSIGFTELLTPGEVEEKLTSARGTTLVVVNSVCGCAAGQCRPGVRKALEHDVTPDHLFAVFAGLTRQDKEATAKAREWFAPYPPSSPSIALLKDGQLVHFIKRQSVEDHSAGQIAADLTAAFDKFCR